MLINRLKSLPTWLKAVLGTAIAAFIAFLVGGTQTMPLNESWTPSIILFTLAGIALVVFIGVLIYWLMTKDRLEHEPKEVVESKAIEAELSKSSRRQKIEKTTLHNNLTKLGCDVNNIDSLFLKLLSSAEKYSPKDYIQAYYMDDLRFQQFRKDHPDNEDDALIMRVELESENPRLKSLQDKNKWATLKLTIENLCGEIADSYLSRLINSYFNVQSIHGREILLRSLIMRYSTYRDIGKNKVILEWHKSTLERAKQPIIQRINELKK
jgi:hypothetical protein